MGTILVSLHFQVLLFSDSAEEADLEMMLSIWREPDAIGTKTANKNRIRLEQKALDGGVYKMVVDLNPKGQPHVVTFYKNKESAES